MNKEINYNQEKYNVTSFEYNQMFKPKNTKKRPSKQKNTKKQRYKTKNIKK